MDLYDSRGIYPSDLPLIVVFEVLEEGSGPLATAHFVSRRYKIFFFCSISRARHTHQLTIL